ncbi:MAG: discoidin domain-containing protein, partial [Planctomycetes bacterium]|nr:discoidin domain-containing protein [Planctomycetota bacterium]
GDLHGTVETTMWTSAGVPPNWIQYEFDRVYRLYDLKVWNSNQLIESFLGFGAKAVTVEYSVDGSTWTALANVPEFAKASGNPDYAANTTVVFGGVEAKFVKLTIDTSWGGMPVAGLSEVRFSYIPVQARAPEPASGAKGVSVEADLNWRPGRQAASHQVFFGTDPNALTAGQTVTDHRHDPGALNFGTTYYWRVDEVNAVTHPGPIWNFTTQEYAVVEDFESYTDEDGSRIYQTWIDGWTNSTGAVVGYLQAPFAERTILHGGKQAMPLEYNNVKTPYYSETERTFAPVQNWSGNGADTLAVWFRGRAVAFLDKGAGSFTLGGGGTDIWNAADQFRFAAKRLTGNGVIVAKVESLVTADPWTKVGVMIRESLAPGSRFAAVYATPGNGVRYQARLTTDVAAVSDTAVATPEQIALRAPVWVKMERTGSNFSGFYSTDGVKWTSMSWNPQTITMAASPVYIGQCATSHNANALTSAEFSNISTTGSVTGGWEVTEIGVAQPSNTAASLYVVVQDSAGKSKAVKHPDPAATTLASWQEWRIPLGEFTSAGVKMTAVKTIVIGVGDRTSPAPGGAGVLYIDDIGFGHSAGQ